jgi:hypothetical protein
VLCCSRGVLLLRGCECGCECGSCMLSGF